MAVKQRTGFNNYIIIDDYAIFYIQNTKGENFEVYIDTEDVPRLVELGLKWVASWKPNIQSYYISTTEYLGVFEGKYKYKHWELHRFIMNAQKGQCVDHIDHNTFDNRKSKLLISNDTLNLKNRKGANKNSGTGVRNVHWIEKHNEYWIQIMKDYVRYKWVFPADKFKEACEFARQKRIELFGKE